MKGLRQQEFATLPVKEGVGCEVTRTGEPQVSGHKESPGHTDGTGGAGQGREGLCLHFFLW